MRYLDEVTVHCSDTEPNWAHDKSLTWIFQEFSRWHAVWGARTCGYHIIINRRGEYMRNPHRPIELLGAHVKGKNSGKIGICILGGKGSNADDDPSDHFTIAQLTTLRKLIDALREKYPTIKFVRGHNQHANRACPGFYVPEWYFTTEPVVRDYVAETVEPSITPAQPSFLETIITLLRGIWK